MIFHLEIITIIYCYQIIGIIGMTNGIKFCKIVVIQNRRKFKSIIMMPRFGAKQN